MKQFYARHILFFLKSKTFSFLLLFFFFPFFFSFSQPWVQQMQDPAVNFYAVQQSFNQFWQGKTIGKGKGWKQFKRWEWFMEPRVYPTGDRTVLLNAAANYKAYHDSIKLQKAPLPGNWTFLGPGTVPTSGGGAGRVNCIRFDPANSNNIWIGTPAGGLWKSTNGGTSWTTNTDQLTVLGVTDIAIDPANTNIMYIATGDGDASDTYSIGVLKSTDGGLTWNATGLTWTVNQVRTISKLLINPNNTNIILAATSNGVYRSTDAGTTWTQTLTGNRKDMEFKPGDPNTVYACGTTFYKSTNGGVNFTQVTSGIPTGVDRLAIAVTAADPAYVYVLAGRSSDSGFRGLYRSTDSGSNFTARSTTPNILGWDCGGTDSGGQSWYDLSLAASPTNRDVVIAGGVNIWRSTNGGTSWSMNAHWYGGCSVPYVHADQHDLVFLPGSGTTYFAGCDGGVFKTTNSGTGWTDLSSNLQIGQMYRLGLSATNVNLALSGWQDNGTNRFNPAWTQVLGGDGMECIVDYSNANIMYGELYYGDIYKSTNGGGSFPTNIANTGGTGVNANGNWVTPYIMHPTNNQTLLVGKGGLYRTTNAGTSWTTLGTLSGGSGNVVAIAYAPSNPNYIYAAKSNAMFVSTNGGTSFTNISSGLPTSSASITYITVSASNPSKAWVTFSGFSSGNKVFQTSNAGSSWTNYSTGLPNLPVNCIVQQNGTSAGVYVGMDVGVYYRDSLAPSWQLFNSGLPNVVINELEIHYGSGKIRAATYGRGMWESSLFTSGNFPPVADFSGSPGSGCPGTSVQFADLSSYTPTSWEWSFSGGTPAVSTSQNPVVTYSSTGNFDVTLVACNAYGCDTITKTQYISISGVLSLPLTEGFESLPFLPAGWIMYNPNNDETWQRTNTIGGFGTSTKCAYFNNCSVDVTGTRDAMYTPKYDFSGLTGATLTFDVAYARYDATYNDTLAVYVSTDCGASFTQVYLKGGSTLATAPDQTSSCFIPSGSQWRKETVSLNSYVGQPNVMVSFENRSHYGQYLFVDNINISGTGGAAPVAGFASSDSTVCAGSSVSFTDQSTGNPTSWNWTFPGGTPASSTLQNPAVTFNTPGTYTITLTATNGNGSDSETKTNYITVGAIPAISVTPNPATICEGSSASLTASGASTYNWSPASGLSSTTDPAVNANPSSTTTYTVTGTQDGCTGTQTVTVNVTTLPSITVTTSSSDICEGSSASLTASGATTYSWSPASGLSPDTGATVTANPASTTTYIVTGTQNNCSDTQSVTINITPSPIVSVTPASPGICTGSSTLLTANGAASYTWSPASGLSATTGSAVTATPSATTTYVVTGTQNSCSDTQSVTVAVSAIPVISVTPVNPAICAGNSTTLTASGADSYTWSPASDLSSTTGSSVTANPPASATYTVTGSTGGCSGTQTVTVNVTPLPAITVSPSSATICAGDPASLAASGASAYSWSPSTGLSATTGSAVDASPSSTTTYTVTGTQNGCNGTQNVTVSVNPVPVVTVTPSSPTICEGSSTSLTAGGAATFIWSPASGLSDTVSASVITSPATTTTYTVSGTTNGCTGTQAVTVNVAPLPIVAINPVSPTICFGNSTVLIATGANTYSWSPPGGLSSSSEDTVTASPLFTTTYSVTGTANGCSNSTAVTVTVSLSPAVTAYASSTGICGGDSTLLVAGGASNYTWSPSTGLSSTTGDSVFASPSVTTTYIVTGSMIGCLGNDTASVTVTVNSPPVVTVSPSSASICSNEAVTLTASGAGNFTWTPATGLSSSSGTSVTANPSSNITYTVTETESGCNSNAAVTINVTTAPDVDVSASADSICTGDSTLLAATGAATYTWSPANNLSSSSGDAVTASPSSDTTYMVVGEQGTCTDTAYILIAVNSPPAVFAASSSDTICQGDSTVLSAGGADSYTWSPAAGLSSNSGQTVNAAPSSNTTYFVTGTTNGCSSISPAQVAVNVTIPPSISVSPASAAACAGDSIILIASGASDFSWSPSQGLNATSGTTVIAAPSSTTVYYAAETESGCNGTAAATVNITAQPVVNVSASPGSICSGDSAILSATGAATYTWFPSADLSDSSGNVIAAFPSSDAVFTVIGTQGSCSDTGYISISVTSSPVISISSSTDTICSGDSAVFSASGASAYTWSPASGLSAISGQTVNSSPSSNTTYSVVGTENGCQSIPSFLTITVKQPLAISVSPASPAVCPGFPVTLIASGAADFTWSPAVALDTTAGNSVVSTPSSTTTYSVIETESGCNGNTVVTVAVNTMLDVSVASASDTICQGDSVVLTAGGAADFTWGPAGSLSSSTGDTVTASPSSNTTYTVSGTSGNCSDSATITIHVNSLPSIFLSATTTSICEGNSSILSASGAADYAWSPSSGLNINTGQTVVATLLSTTTYTATGTDDNGCSGSNTITITVAQAPVVTVSPSFAFICSKDSALISAGGNATSYSWLPEEGLNAFSGPEVYAAPDSTTLYTVTGTDDNGCTNSATIAVSLYPSLNSITTNVDASCESEDGKAIAVASGGASPFSYLWSDADSQATAIAQGLLPGIYFVTITDVNGCRIVDSSVVNLSSSLNVNVIANGAICGNNDGEAMAAATGGPLPYSYLWSDSSNTLGISGISAGTYSVTVSDFAGCIKIISIEVGTKPPVISKYILNESCDGKSDGSVAITLTGGTTPYSYLWSDESATEDISGLTKGMYFLTVTDSAGCQATDSAVIELTSQNCLSIPTGFTPNSDGKNDHWKIRGAEEYPEITVEIFNRWGARVFSSKGYDEPWDGGGLPSAAYYYIITFGDGTSTTGTVTIVR